GHLVLGQGADPEPGPLHRPARLRGRAGQDPGPGAGSAAHPGEPARPRADRHRPRARDGRGERPPVGHSGRRAEVALRGHDSPRPIRRPRGVRSGGRLPALGRRFLRDRGHAPGRRRADPLGPVSPSPRTKRRDGLALALVLGALVRDGHAAPVREVVPVPARGFALTEVRLLDGPFRDAMLRDEQFLLGLDLDRLLHTFRLNAGLPSSAAPLGGWEAPDVELRGHSLGHFLSASALMYAATGDGRFKARAGAVVAELARIQEALAPRSNPGYLSAFPEEFF